MKKIKKALVVKIDQEACIGCGACVDACKMGAIQLIDGKAQVVAENHCDGLGVCLPQCPVDAITLVERQTTPAAPAPAPLPCGCPGSQAKKIQHPAQTAAAPTAAEIPSQLSQWPVQIKLVNAAAPYLQGAHLLIAADCTAYAYGDFHRQFIKGHIVLVGCPKLDDLPAYKEKFIQILQNNEIQSITVARMEVPCCTGISQAIQQALEETGCQVPFQDTIITTDGQLIEQTQ